MNSKITILLLVFTVSLIPLAYPEEVPGCDDSKIYHSLEEVIKAGCESGSFTVNDCKGYHYYKNGIYQSTHDIGCSKGIFKIVIEIPLDCKGDNQNHTNLRGESVCIKPSSVEKLIDRGYLI